MNQLLTVLAVAATPVAAWLGAWWYCRRFPVPVEWPTIEYRALVYKEDGVWHWVCTCGAGGGLRSTPGGIPGFAWELVLWTAQHHVGHHYLED